MTHGALLASVVICVHADSRARRTVAALLDQTATPTDYEIVVVENGSAGLSDLTHAAPGRLRYLHVRPANTALARNVGLTAARGTYLLLTDADCVPDRRWVDAMTAALSTGRHTALGGRIGKYEPRSATQRHGITVVDGQRALNYLPALPLPYVVGANSGYVTAAVRSVGGFDDNLPSGHDVDLCYRLGLCGHSIGLAPEAVVLHEDRRTVAAHFRRFRRYAIYQVGLHSKYRSISGRRAVLNPYPFRRAAGALAALPYGLCRLAVGDREPVLRAGLQLVEAVGVSAGDLAGSVRYRQLYL